MFLVLHSHGWFCFEWTGQVCIFPGNLCFLRELGCFFLGLRTGNLVLVFYFLWTGLCTFCSNDIYKVEDIANTNLAFSLIKLHSLLHCSF